MRSILFFDPVCPKPYTPETLVNEGLGGTEATVIRVAEKLAQSGIKVTVAQHNRTRTEQFGAKYMHPIALHGNRHDSIVVIRSAGALAAVNEIAPTAKLYLWLHDLAGKDLLHNSSAIQTLKPTIIGVSRFHKTNITELLLSTLSFEEMPRVTYLYNPVSDDLLPDNTPIDRNKVVFFSSPHKGLERTLDVFRNALKFNPEFKLYLANPGYYTSRETSSESNVINLGSIPHHKVIEHVRNSLCVFHLNCIFPETMGLVYAECQAVGTPFLSHALGAVPELSDHPSQLVNVRDPRIVIDRVMDWHNGNRPRVRLKPEIRATHVNNAWIRLLSQ